MKIDRSNYEAYMIDYLEGKLGEEDRRMVEDFLSAHPDIAEEIEQIGEQESVTEDATVLEKSSLLRNYSDLPGINSENFEEFCIAYHEGDLDKAAQIRLMAYLNAHPERRTVFELYQQLKAIPDKTISYPGKSGLKKYRLSPIRRMIPELRSRIPLA